MEIILGTPRGFCAGVVRAIDIVEIALKKFGPPIYVKHQIVHNPYVVRSLEQKGAVTVEDVRDVPPGSVVVFSAHGSPPEDFNIARSLNIEVIDATCPLVTRVHNEALKYHREGKKIILIGHRGHQEVRGTMGQVPMELLDDRDAAALPEWTNDSEVAVITQTTLSVSDTAQSVESIQSKFHNTLLRNDICYATTNRQDATKKLASRVDLVLVIGAQNSSNCNRLREVAENAGVPAYLINGVDDLDSDWLIGVSKLGITSGASTPEVLLDEVIMHVKPDNVTTIEGVHEEVTFVLPKNLR